MVPSLNVGRGRVNPKRTKPWHSVCPFGTLAVTLSIAESQDILPTATIPLRSKAPIDEKSRAAEASKRRVSLHSSKNNSRHSDKYQRILDAAILVIAEHGYFQSRVSEIAEREGSPTGRSIFISRTKKRS